MATWPVAVYCSTLPDGEDHCNQINLKILDSIMRIPARLIRTLKYNISEENMLTEDIRPGLD